MCELWNEPNIPYVVPPSGGTNPVGGTNRGKEDQAAGGDTVPPKGGTTSAADVLSLGKDEAAREATQAKYLPRRFLTNVANDIPLSIWCDWRDDGDDLGLRRCNRW